MIALPYILVYLSIASILSSVLDPPDINIADETRIIDNHLTKRYGKPFKVGDIVAHGVSQLGETSRITANAHPMDDENLNVSLIKTPANNGSYTDDYLTLYWSKEDEELTSATLNNIFGYIPGFTSSVDPRYVFNRDYEAGRVIKLDEMLEKYKDKVSYSLRVDLDFIDQSSSQTDLNAKFYQVADYAKNRFKPGSSTASFSYETADMIYSCSLYGVKLSLIESPDQLSECWSAKPKGKTTTPSGTTISNSIQSISHFR